MKLFFVAITHPEIFKRPAVLLAATLIFTGHTAIATDAPVPPAPPVAAATLKYESEWRIKCNGGADNDGVARFRVTPLGTAPIEVTVKVKRGRSENGVAKDIKKTFAAALKKMPFEVEGDDFEDVLVRKEWGGKKFSLELIESTIKGTKFKIQVE